MDSTTIREIEPGDNNGIAAVIRSVLQEFNVPLNGTALSDPELDRMFEAYDSKGSVYYIIEQEGEIAGGAGISQLRNAGAQVCELQKMYFLSTIRGRGLGRNLINKCLSAAKKMGYQKCYLETMPYMQAAQSLYLRSGFKFLSGPMGNTGHTSCPVWMLLDLETIKYK